MQTYCGANSQTALIADLIGVRGGGRGASDPQGLKKFRANSVFRATASCSKILNNKIYFSTVKNSRAPSVYQGKLKLLKNHE